jgi:hypothetical protein
MKVYLHNPQGQPVIWDEKDDGTLHFDCPRYAAWRHISLKEAEVEIAEMMRELVPGIDVTSRD